MRKYRHLFFDLDHTLWDFETNSQEAILDLYQKHQLEDRLETSVHDFMAAYYQINDELWALYRKGEVTKQQLRHQRFQSAFHRFGHLEQEIIEVFEQEYMYITPRKTALLPGCLPMLTALKPYYSMHIITNGFSEAQKLKMEGSGLRPFFDEVFCSDVVGITKPQAGIFIEALKQTGATRKNSLMIGDNLSADVSGARNVGMDQVFYNPKGDAHQDKVTFEITHLSELTELLLPSA